MTITGNVTCNALDRDGTSNGADSDQVPNHESLFDQVRELGFRRVHAFVLDTNAKQRSKNAERVAKHRAKAAADGKKAIQLVVDEDSARTLREVIAIMERRQLPAEAALQAEFEEKYSVKLGLADAVLQLSGWRWLIARWIGLPLGGEDG